MLLTRSDKAVTNATMASRNVRRRTELRINSLAILSRLPHALLVQVVPTIEGILLRKTLAASAASFLFAVSLSAATAEPDVVSTHCRESEVPLDETHTVARLGDCGDPTAIDLLWHLDRIDQTDANLDGLYHHRRGGAGSVVYVMDTGLMASHDEFATPSGRRVLAGLAAPQSVAV